MGRGEACPSTDPRHRTVEAEIIPFQFMTMGICVRSVAPPLAGSHLSNCIRFNLFHSSEIPTDHILNQVGHEGKGLRSYIKTVVEMI